MRKMREEEIPAFVEELVGLGCEISAVGSGYVVGDADLEPAEYDAIEHDLKALLVRYGSRDHLMRQISSHLRAIGRCEG